jgi:uncharacterized protein YlxW (UPF0749 family)
LAKILSMHLQAEVEVYKKEALHKTPRRQGEAAWKKEKADFEAREAALRAEVEATNEALNATKEEAQALSASLEKANALIEVASSCRSTPDM